MITADHGNDPTDVSTDHTRERVPILITGGLVKKNTNLGTRSGFSDMAASIAELLGVTWYGPGLSFASQAIRDI